MKDFYGSIVISSLEEMEEKTRAFSRQLTPLQRLEYLLILNEMCYSEVLANNREQLWDKEIVIAIP